MRIVLQTIALTTAHHRRTLPVAARSPLCLSLAPRRMLYRSAHRGIHFSSFISAATQVFCAFRRVGVYARVLWDGRLFC